MSNHVDQLHPRVQFVDTNSGLLTPFAFKWLVQVYKKLGGPQDFVDDNDNSFEYTVNEAMIANLQKNVENLQYDNENYSDSKLKQIENQLSELETEIMIGRSVYLDHLTFPAKEISADYTTYKNEILICTDAITITLNTKPKYGERLYIKRTNGQVTIVGTIDGKTNLIINGDNASVTLVYTANGWWIL